MNKKWIKDAPQLKQEFENFIKEHGTKIELEKVDTTNWKTYKDEKRGFEFKYPNDWYVIPIDSSKWLMDNYSKEGQWQESRLMKQYATNCEKPFRSASMIKGCTQPYPFLCLADQYTYESIPQRFKDKNSIYRYDHEYCDIVLEEAFPRLKSSDKSAGRMWLEAMQIPDYQYLKYIINDNMYLVSESNPPFISAEFCTSNGSFIEVQDQHHGIPIILHTIKYTN